MAPSLFEVVELGSFGKGGGCNKDSSLGFGGGCGVDKNIVFVNSQLGKAPQQKRICWVDSGEDVWPTDSAVRQKTERKVREETFEQDGPTKEEIKTLPGKTKFDQEDHYDDCGSDLGPLNEMPLVNVLAVSGSLNSSIAYCYLEHDVFNSSSADPSEDDSERIFNDKFSLYYGVGYDGVGEHQDPPKSSVIDVNDL